MVVVVEHAAVELSHRRVLPRCCLKSFFNLSLDYGKDLDRVSHWPYIVITRKGLRELCLTPIEGRRRLRLTRRLTREVGAARGFAGSTGKGVATVRGDFRARPWRGWGGSFSELG